MHNILTTEEAIEIAGNLNKNKKIVVAGGCFDILHVGHVRFLQSSRKQGNVLFVLLESDENVRKLKGDNRPINSQKDRAEILSNLKSVDYTVLLPYMKSDQDYDKLIFCLKPNILATTENDPGIEHKTRQAKTINARVKKVIVRLESSSSTLVRNMLSKK